MFEYYNKYKDELAMHIFYILNNYGDDSLEVRLLIIDNEVRHIVQPKIIVADPVMADVLFRGTLGQLRNAVAKNGLDEYVRMLLV